MCVGHINAFVKFKTDDSNPISFSEDRHFSIPCTYNNVYNFIHVHINVKNKSNTCLTFNVHVSPILRASTHTACVTPK